MAALLCVGFLDELASGVPVVAAPEIRSELGAGYAALSWIVLAAPLALSVVIELPLLVLSDGWPRRRTLVAALWAGAFATAGAACASSGWMLAIALSLWGVSTGVASGAAQAALVESAAEGSERALARWGLAGMLGDALAPALIAAIAVVEGSWRLAFALIAGVYAAQAWWAGSASIASARAHREEEIGLVQALRSAVGNRRLWLWLLASALCSLLDETLVAFGGLFLRDVRGASAAMQSLAFVAFALGGALGLVVVERLLVRVASLRLLGLCAGSCLVVYLAWLVAPSAELGIALLFCLGALAAPLHPIAQAQAYASCPGRPGLVAALGQLTLPFEVAVPVLLGMLADRFGLGLALLVLAAQPLGLLLIALYSGRERARR